VYLETGQRTGRFRRRAGVAVGMLLMTLALPGCSDVGVQGGRQQASTTKVDAVQSTSKGEVGERPASRADTFLQDISIGSDGRSVVTRYPAGNCAGQDLYNPSVLPKPWVLQGCGPDQLVVTAQLVDLGLPQATGSEFLDRHVLVQVFYDPAAISYHFDRRVAAFGAHFRQGPERQRQLAQYLDGADVGGFRAAGYGEADKRGVFIGRMYLHDVDKNLVCEIQGPDLYLFECAARRQNHVVVAMFLRRAVGPNHTGLLTTILRDVSALSGEHK
jgi:hypothetical protein